MHIQRVISLVDGLNLYHAISYLKRPELNWLDLKALSRIYLKTRSEQLSQVFYFSAFAEHVSASEQKRQKSYLQALELSGVTSILGYFNKKDRKCPSCRHTWHGHEEKQTDVNIALFLLDLAYQNAFDRALVVSNDSDLAPAIQKVRERFPEKRITTVAPPHRFHSRELIFASSDKTKILVEHLERSLLPHSASHPQEYLSVSK